MIAAAGLGFLGTWPPLATVMSASMEPTIKTGDVVVLRKLDGPPRVGEIVAVSVPPNIRTRFGYPPVIIHRIIKIDGKGVVTTKGDAYKEKDPFDVPTSALTTKVVATVPAAGRVLGFLGSSLGLLWLAGGVLMFVGMPLLERYRDVQRRDEHDRTDLHDTLRSVTDELALMRVERDRELDAAAREAAESEQQRAAERDAAKREAARLEQLRAAERDRELRAAVEDAAAAQEQLRAANAALTKHLEDLPAQIERAVAAAISAFVTPPAPPPPARMAGLRRRLGVDATHARTRPDRRARAFCRRGLGLGCRARRRRNSHRPFPRSWQGGRFRGLAFVLIAITWSRVRPRARGAGLVAGQRADAHEPRYAPTHGTEPVRRCRHPDR